MDAVRKQKWGNLVIAGLLGANVFLLGAVVYFTMEIQNGLMETKRQLAYATVLGWKALSLQNCKAEEGRRIERAPGDVMPPLQVSRPIGGERGNETNPAKAIGVLPSRGKGKTDVVDENPFSDASGGDGVTLLSGGK